MNKNSFIFVSDDGSIEEAFDTAKKLFAGNMDVFVIFQTMRPGKRQAFYDVFQGHKITSLGVDALPPSTLAKARRLWGEMWPSTKNGRGNHILWIQHLRIRTSGAGEVVKQSLSRAAEPSDFATGFGVPKKACIVCGEEKPLTDFCIRYAARAHREGLKKEHCHSYCKDCNSLYNKWRTQMIAEFGVGSLAEIHMLGYELSSRWVAFRDWVEMQAAEDDN